MSRDAQEKWTDPRTPVEVCWVGKFKVTIYDMEKYEESKLLYPDDPNKDKLHVPKANKVAPFEKQKPASRYNWITPLDQPLKGRTHVS